MEKISVVVSCYNEEKALPLFYKEMERIRKPGKKERKEEQKQTQGMRK